MSRDVSTALGDFELVNSSSSWDVDRSLALSRQHALIWILGVKGRRVGTCGYADAWSWIWMEAGEGEFVDSKRVWLVLKNMHLCRVSD